MLISSHQCCVFTLWWTKCCITWLLIQSQGSMWFGKSHVLGFSRGSAGKESSCNAGDLGLIPGLGRSPGEGKGYPFQYSGLENSRDCIVHGVTRSQTQLSDFHFTWQKESRNWDESKWHALSLNLSLNTCNVFVVYMFQSRKHQLM